MTPRLQQRFDDAIHDRLLLDHPFYRRWEAGELAREELTHYAEQYRHFETMLPLFLRRLSAKLGPGGARDLVDANLADEVSAPSHLQLFEGFASFYGARDVEMSPATRALVEAYSDVLRRGPVAALAGLLAYESQGAAIADSKADGLAQHYGASRQALEFWQEHGSIEGDHAQWTFDALESLRPNVAEVERSARAVAEAWWAFLDERQLAAA